MNQAMPERLAVCFTEIYLQRFACYSEITDTPLEEFLQEIENNPKIKFTTKGGIEELKKRVEREKKEKNNKKER